MFRRSVSWAVALLAGFHAWLFAGQLWDGRAFDPATAGRWLIAAGLLGILIRARRRRPAAFGRQAAAIWVLAALLHAPRALDQSHGLLPVVWTEVATTAAGLAAPAAGLGLMVLAALSARRPSRRPAAGRPLLDGVLTGTVQVAAAGLVPTFAPRPPPTA
jgi:hypothetical protein